MSTPQPPTQPYRPQPPQAPLQPPAPAKKRSSCLTPILIFAALILGLIVGTASAGGSAKPAATVTVAGPAAGTITRQVTTTATATLATTVTAQPAPPAPPAGTFQDGTWLVNKDIKPGQYRSANESGGCYWARLKNTDGTMDSILANGNPGGPTVVTIKPTDVAFESARCGAWQPV